MPLTASAIKRARQSLVRQDRRTPYKTLMKTMIRKCMEAAKAGKKEEVIALLPKTYKVIDTAAKKGIIHPSNAARKKSSMARLAAAK
jgi:small subunit ribosomal protein S20